MINIIIENMEAKIREFEALRKANTGRYSENHQVHLFTENIGNYKKLYDLLFDNHIAVNFDNPLIGGIFIRLGTQEVTRRGMKEKEMRQIAKFIDRSFKGEKFTTEVTNFMQKYQKAAYSFDETQYT